MNPTRRFPPAPRDLPAPLCAVAWSEPLPAHYLMAGEMLVCDEPCAITTVLGSCVAVTMFHSRSGRAAICHGMLPHPPADTDTDTLQQPYRFLTLAIPAMIGCFRNTNPRGLEVKIFGGANVLQPMTESWQGSGVGQANVEEARAQLATANLRVTAADVGGDRGRKIIFNTLSGTVMMRRLSASPFCDAPLSAKVP